MRITFILPGFSRFPVGGFQVVYEYANFLAKRGHNVEIVHAMFLPTQVKPNTKELAKYLLKQSMLKMGIIKPWFKLDARVQVINKGRITKNDIRVGDRVIATAWETSEFVNTLPKECGVKYYFIQHYETWGGKERVDKTWKLPLKKIVIASWLQKIAKRMDENATLVPNFVEHENFFVTKPIEKRSAVVSMLYSEHAVKGTADGISALNMVKKKYPDITIKIFGVYDHPKNLPEGTLYYKAPSRNQLRNDIYNDSSIYLFPSISEGWGLTATEAMACGAALVSTENGGVDDFGVEGETALISAPRDPQGLYLNICKLLSNDQLRIRLAKKGKQLVMGLTLEESGALFERALE
ncbi:hypothetical protein A6F53_09875 [Levilactobacillus brevis]|uniref:glycosyltransferase family 4 protein n=1 Tax=Levilactobacillus brevis TaxID=1580 RepID=UPI0007F8E4A9|nr:glycosyltransferase family 4 protein [Levilactobacillus brevis]ANN49533.1 hypothetical protein A6F53_09875 [Levilactobacillus brevis]